MLRHYECTATLNTSAQSAFEFLDNPKRLSSHMSKSSWMMAGSKMDIEVDAKLGREIGSEITLRGRMMGIPLFVYEKIMTRVPPFAKSWETIGRQKMIILDQYRMGFELTPKGNVVQLRVFIDYKLPEAGIPRLLGLLSASVYAKWCVDRMVRDSQGHFN